MNLLKLESMLEQLDFRKNPYSEKFYPLCWIQYNNLIKVDDKYYLMSVH